MTDQNPTDESAEQINATISVDSVVKSIKLNNTDGVDDRVIAVPRHGGTAKVRRAFQGSERYSNPSSAPIHIGPGELVEDEWRSMPTRADVDTLNMDIPDERADWTDEDEEAYEEAYDAIIDVWETDVRGMVEGRHEIDAEESIVLTAEGDN